MDVSEQRTPQYRRQIGQVLSATSITNDLIGPVIVDVSVTEAVIQQVGTLPQEKLPHYDPPTEALRGPVVVDVAVTDT